MRWWRGHWFKRRSCGQWREDGGPYVCHEHHGHKGEHRFTPAPPELLYRRAAGGRRLSGREREATEYKAYLEARLAAADDATRGVMLSAEGERRGIRSRQWFDGRSKVSDRYASDELKEWLQQHGRTLTASEYHAQHRERHEDDAHPYADVLGWR